MTNRDRQSSTRQRRRQRVEVARMTGSSLRLPRRPWWKGVRTGAVHRGDGHGRAPAGRRGGVGPAVGACGWS